MVLALQRKIISVPKLPLLINLYIKIDNSKKGNEHASNPLFSIFKGK